MYRFRYRSLNTNGWAAFSPITYIKAAARPVRPPPPVFMDATDNSVTIGLFRTPDDGGDEVTRYRLFRNNGGL